MGVESSKCYQSYGRYSIQGRRREMEDKTIMVPEFSSEDCALFGVFDGHNGNNCSKFLSTNFPEFLKKNNYLTVSPSMALIQSFLELDKTFLKKCCTSGDKSGSTGVTTLIKDGQIFIANTGDSRCIIVEDAVVYALTNDHKPSIPFERDRILNSGGHITQGRVEGTLAVARAFGDIEYKDKSTFGAGVLTCEPEIKIWNILDSTEFMVLACDGLWDVLTNEMVANHVRKKLLKGVSAEKVCESLVRYAYGEGSTDNISVVIVSFIKKSYFEKNPEAISKEIKCDDPSSSNLVKFDTDNDSSDLSTEEIEEHEKKERRRRQKKEKREKFSKNYFGGDDDECLVY